jgi:NADH-quinone oxidoreductase subunit J
VTALDVAFAAVGLIAAASGLLAVTTRHVVHSALWLVVCLGSVAGCYLVLGAEFVALVQLLVYVGAIVVLVLFALMLTRAPIGANPDVSTSGLHRVLAAVLGGGVTALLAAALLPVAGPARPRRETSTTALAEQLFGTWVWPFEVLSLLLLVSLVAALAVARMGTTTHARDRGDAAEAGHPADGADLEPVEDPA